MSARENGTTYAARRGRENREASAVRQEKFDQPAIRHQAMANGNLAIPVPQSRHELPAQAAQAIRQRGPTDKQATTERDKEKDYPHGVRSARRRVSREAR